MARINLALVFLSLGLVLLGREIKQLLCRSRTYECTEGLVELEGTDVVVVALRWDQVVELQQAITVGVGIRTISISHTYYAVEIDGVKREIVYRACIYRAKETDRARADTTIEPKVIVIYQAGRDQTE